MRVANPYCERLGIQVPRLDVAKDSPDAREGRRARRKPIPTRLADRRSVTRPHPT